MYIRKGFGSPPNFRLGISGSHFHAIYLQSETDFLPFGRCIPAYSPDGGLLSAGEIDRGTRPVRGPILTENSS